VNRPTWKLLSIMRLRLMSNEQSRITQGMMSKSSAYTSVSDDDRPRHRSRAVNAVQGTGDDTAVQMSAFELWNYRKVNELIKKDKFPLPKIDTCLNTLNGCQYYSSCDLRWGYWQTEINERDRDKTAFVTRKGQWRFNVRAN